MIHKSINFILISAVFVLSLFLIEGASYRLVEPYANWRLQFAWGTPEVAGANPILKKLPLDHFVTPPSIASQRSTPLSLLKQEFEYAKKITRFDRPARDRYFNFAIKQVNPLRNFEIVDLGMVEGVVLPGMRRPATPGDVELGLARREGLPVSYSKALFVHIIPPGSRAVYETEFARLESAFSFLLNHGIACVLLHPQAPDELQAKLKFLKAQYPNFSEKVFAYAQGKAVKTIADAARNESNLLTALIVKNPSEEVALDTSESSWFMGIISKGKTDKQIDDSLIQRARLNRENDNIYHARLSGLIFEDSELENMALSSNTISYILNSLEFFRPIELSEQNAQSENESNNSLDGNLLGRLEGNLSQLAITNLQGLEPSEAEPTFECDVIREYRQLHADDPEIENVSNRELVLSLGSSFEKMGDDILIQIGEQDPLFYRFYLSLKEIHSSDN